MNAESKTIEHYRNSLSWKNRLGRLLWAVVYLLFFRFSPKPCRFWRRFLLRCFGGKIAHGAIIDPSVKIFAPWNLEMAEFSCLAFDVDCYNVDIVRLGKHATVSQYAFLCTASHDLTDPNRRLITAPITIEENAWVFARAFIGPGVTIHTGAVAGACSVVVKDVPAWAIVAGNPAKFIKQRELKTTDPGLSS